jgi:hypothetical protein
MGLEIGKCKCNCNKDNQQTANFENINNNIIEYNNSDNNQNSPYNISSPMNQKNLKEFVNCKTQTQNDSSFQKKQQINPLYSSINSQFVNTASSKYTEKNNNDNYKITLIQSVFRGYNLRKNYKYLKQKQIQETNQLLKDFIEQYTKFNLKRAESLIGTKFDKNGYKLYYNDENEINKLFNFDYGKIYNTKILIISGIIPSFYTGEVNINNERHGYGILLKNDGTKYEGHWKNNIFNGWGRFIDYDGTLIECNFINGKANGKGMKKTLNGLLYIGDFIDNLKDGYGKEETNEHIYEGEFKKDKKNGNGKLIYKLLNDVYEGEFKDNCITGVGFYTWKNKDTYKGTFVNGKMHGKGFYKWPDGGEYYGDYVNNIKEGNGKFKWSNGRIFEGQFKKGKPHGFGKLKIGNMEFKVEFNNGKLVTNIKELMKMGKEIKNKNNEYFDLN